MCSQFFDKLFPPHRCKNELNLHKSTSLDMNNLNNTTTSASNLTNPECERMIDLISIESLEEEEDDDDEDYAMFEDLTTRCECGVELTKGWQCNSCRVNCSQCNRALTKDPEDYCTRCNIKCQTHGLFKRSSYKTCPQC